MQKRSMLCYFALLIHNRLWMTFYQGTYASGGMIFWRA